MEVIKFESIITVISVRLGYHLFIEFGSQLLDIGSCGGHQRWLCAWQQRINMGQSGTAVLGAGVLWVLNMN